MYLLGSESFGKKGVSRDMVSASVFMGSGLQAYKMNAQTEKLTTGYTELLSLMYERNNEDNSYELQDYRTGELINKVFDAPMSPHNDSDGLDIQIPEGTITVVVHEKANYPFESGQYRKYDIDNMSASAVMEAVLVELKRAPRC